MEWKMRCCHVEMGLIWAHQVDDFLWVRMQHNSSLVRTSPDPDLLVSTFHYYPGFAFFLPIEFARDLWFYYFYVKWINLSNKARLTFDGVRFCMIFLTSRIKPIGNQEQYPINKLVKSSIRSYMCVYDHDHDHDHDLDLWN